MSTSACFPARRLPHPLPQFFLVISPPAAVAEEVLPRLGHCPSTPPALVVVSVAEPFQVNSRGRVPGLQSVEPRLFILLYGISFFVWVHSVFYDPGPLYYWMALRAILSKEKTAEFEEIAREVRNYYKYKIRTNLRRRGLFYSLLCSCIALGQEDATLTAVLSVIDSVPTRFFARVKFIFRIPRCQRAFCAFLVIGYKVFATEQGLKANLKDSGNIWAFGQLMALILAIPAILEVLRLLKFAISGGRVGLPISVPNIPRESRCPKLADGTYTNLRPDSQCN